MKSTVPAGTIEVSAHIQIAIDKERKGSPTITNLKPPLTLVQTKKRLSYPGCSAAGTIWDLGGGEIEIIAQKCFRFANCFHWSHLFLTGDHPTTTYAISIV